MRYWASWAIIGALCFSCGDGDDRLGSGAGGTGGKAGKGGAGAGEAGLGDAGIAGSSGNAGRGGTGAKGGSGGRGGTSGSSSVSPTVAVIWPAPALALNATVLRARAMVAGVDATQDTTFEF